VSMQIYIRKTDEQEQAHGRRMRKTVTNLADPMGRTCRCRPRR
jgi:hypothetical protein